MGGSKAVKADLKLMVQEPETWRGDSKGFMYGATPAERRAAYDVAREEARAFETGENFEESADETQYMKVSEEHFFIAMEKWFPSRTREESNQMWKETHTAQKGLHDKKSGDKRIKVAHPVETSRQRKGTKRSSGVTQSNATSDEAFRARMNNLKRKHTQVEASSSDDEDGSDGTGASDSDEPQMVVPRASSSIDGRSALAPPTLAGSSVRGSPDDDNHSLTSSKKSGKSGKGSGSTHVKKIAKAEAAALDLAEAVVPLPPIAKEFGKVNSAIDVKFLKDKDPAEFNTQEFLGAKSALKTAINMLLEKLGDTKGGLIGDILSEQAALEKRNGMSQDLNHDTPTLVAGMMEAVTKLSFTSSELVAAKAPALKNLRKAYTDVFKSLEPIFVDYGDHVPALRARNADASKAHKKGFQQDYWKTRRVTESLTTGGHVSAFAKLPSTLIANEYYKPDGDVTRNSMGNINVDPAAADFDDKVVTSFFHSSAISMFRGQVSLAKDAFTEKRDKLHEALVENENWPGAQGVVSGLNFETQMLHFLDELFGASSHSITQMAGGRVWMRIALGNTNNHGPHSNMLPGLASFYWSDTDKITLVINPFDALLKRGITAECYEEFFSGPSAKKFAEQNMIVLHLKPFEMCYVPEGMMVHVIQYQQPSGRKGWRAAPFTFCNFALSKPFRGDDNTKNAFGQWNKSYFDSKAKSTMWKERKEFFDSVMALTP
jgi:hypothetical protein